MTDSIKKLVQSSAFQNFILLIIVIAAVLVGIETYPTMVADYGETLDLLNQIVLWIFVAEAVWD